MEAQDRPVTVLDGDLVRQLLSSGLGFSTDDRKLNIKRIGYVASLVVKSGGCVVAAPIAPHADARAEFRRMVSEFGGHFECHLSTALETCEHRDRKGLYKLARSGKLKGFTGIDDVYEIPENPELRLDTGALQISDSVDKIIEKLKDTGYIQREQEEKLL